MCHSATFCQLADACSYPPLLPRSRVFIRNLACQWNINCLFGAAAHADHPVSAASIMDVLSPLNPDVIFLQEACILSYGPPSLASPNWWDLLPDSSSRIARLHHLLRDAGYVIVQADGCPNPAMVATRLPVSSLHPSFVIDVDPFLSQMKAQHQPEFRTARLAVLKVGVAEDSPEFVAVVSHLHHKETLAHPGLRLAEVRSITQRLHAAVASRPHAAAIFATDFNGPRRQDYNDREWALIQQAKRKLGEVENDGVADELLREGFVCTYGGRAPVLTHWSSTTVDFGYLLQPQSGRWAWSAAGSYVVAPGDSGTLSDHVPVVHDFDVVRSAD
jgi:endonuclease/exonuclease/phosphatase family metal-dependent hydrolase